MRDLWADLRYAVRMHLRSPVTTLVMIVALALGIGVNSSTFISVESIVLHPLPYRNLERIVVVQERNRSQPGDRLPLTPADYLDLHSSAHAFSAFAAYDAGGVTYSGGQENQRLRSARVSPQFFTALGMQPLAGRTFSGTHETGDQRRVAAVSEGFAQTHLLGTSAVGSAIRLNGQIYTVAAVMPDSFDWPLATDVWLPLDIGTGAASDRTSHDYGALALLKQGSTAEQAADELNIAARRLEAQFPDSNAGRQYAVSSLRDFGQERVTERFIFLLTAASTFVLLLACANVGNLQLARAATREREIAVRAALGASRFRVVRQITVECVLLSVVSGLIGLALASWRNDATKATIPAVAYHYVPGLRTMHVDGTVAIFCVLVSILAGVISVLPAMFDMLRKKDGDSANEALRGRSTSMSAPSRNRLRGALIVFELALSLVLLIGAGLMVSTFERINHRVRGYDTANVLQLRVGIPAPSAANRSTVLAYQDAALSALAGMHDVGSVAVVHQNGIAQALEVEGRGPAHPGEPRPSLSSVSSAYFATLRIPVLAGRSLSASDRAERPPVAVISRSLARYYWPAGDPVGHRIRLDPRSGWLTVVGVCGDVVTDWFSGIASKDVYLSNAQSVDPNIAFLVKAKTDPERLARTAQQLLLKQDSTAPPYDVKTLQQAENEERGGIEVAEKSMTMYAVIALILAVTGIYAVVSYFVAARTHDIGVRIALGAGRGDVLALVMKQAVLLTALGLAFGIPVSALLARAMGHFMYDVIPNAPSTFVLFSAVLAGSSLIASYLPTRRALRIDPMTALRNE